jgi:beta-lactamase regulating signal transducer with metallopeptidase domain
MTPILSAFSAALLHLVWQGLLVTILLWVALFLLRNSSPTARYLASCAALAAMAVLPAITTWLVWFAPASPLPSPAGFALAPLPPPEMLGAPSTASRWTDLAPTWVLPVWSCGVLLFSLRVIWGCRQVSLLGRRGVPAAEPIPETVRQLAGRMGLTRRVQAMISVMPDGPSVVGWLRPLILLPASAIAGLTPQQLEAVLAHELAHIARRDYLVNLLQMAAETLLFYHPAVWWISSRIRRERELCCDDLAVRACNDALCYARALAELEKLRLAAPELAMAGACGTLLYRIQRLAGVARETGPSRAVGVIALVLALASAGVSVRWAHAQSQDGVPGRLGILLGAPDDGVKVETGGATLLHRPLIEFPGAQAPRTVVMEVSVGDAGQVADARVVGGTAELRAPCLRAVLGFHFGPDAAGRTLQIRIVFPAARKTEGDVTLGAAEAKGLAGGDKGLPGELKQVTIAGQKLESITFEGLTDVARAQLLPLLRLREGEILTQQTIDRVGDTVGNFDEHLISNWLAFPDAGGVILMIGPRAE